MADSNKRQTAELVRINYRKRLFKAGEGLALDKPTIVDAITGDADGLMPVGKVGAPLKVTIPLWPDRPDPGLPFTNKLYLDWAPSGSSEFREFHNEDVPDSGTLPDDAFPLDREIPLAVFQNYEGKFEFRYRVKNWNTPVETDSTPAPVTIDRTGPIRPDIPKPIIVIAPLITTVILDRDNGVKCEIPDFVEDKKEFVTVAVAWGDKPWTEIPDPSELAYLGLLPANRQILVPKELVTRLGSKLHYVVYFLFDKAGNRSDMPLPVEVQVALGDLPTGLASPTVPLADDDLIDRADAAFPTTVHIKEFLNWQTTDGIVIKWGDTKLARTSVGAHLPFPLKVTVPWSRMSAVYDFVAGGVQLTDVDYEVLRGDHPIASPGKIEVKVDLAIPGPENPNPEPINPDLELVRFESFSGSATKLTLADANEPATGYIKLFDNPKAGDKLTLYWNGVAVSSPPYEVDGTEDPNEEVSIIIPWVDIVLTPVMIGLPMYYTLTRTGFNNPQESDRTTVDVKVQLVDLEEPTFPDQDPGYPLNCNALIEKAGVFGIRVHIPASDYLKEGMEVTVDWQTYGKDKTTPLPDTHLPDVLTVSEQQEKDGVDWFIPYDKCLKPTYDTGDQYGWGKTKYTLVIHGEDVSSDLVEVMIAVFENGAHCAIPRP